MHENLKKLIALTEKLDKCDAKVAAHEMMLKNVSDSIELAVWAKDLNGKFVYANRLCCDVILRCTEKEALAMTDEDFEHNALASACIISDRKTVESRRACRYIEHAHYEDHDLWLDVVKSPWWVNGDIVGTVGYARDITVEIDAEVRALRTEAESIFIY